MDIVTINGTRYSVDVGTPASVPDIDLKTMVSLAGYRLAPGSPCVDAGLSIENNGGQDLLRTAIGSGGANIGAFECMD